MMILILLQEAFHKLEAHTHTDTVVLLQNFEYTPNESFEIYLPKC